MTLTPREYEVARLFALGRTWEEVQNELGLSRNAISFHRKNAMAKAEGTMQSVWVAEGWLHVPTAAEARLLAARRELEAAEVEAALDAAIQLTAPDSTPGDESPVAAVTPAPS